VSAEASSKGLDQARPPIASSGQEALAKVPLYFEANVGQFAQPVKFISRSSQQSFLLTGNAIEFTSNGRAARLGTREDFINKHALLRRDHDEITRHNPPRKEAQVQLRFAQAKANPMAEGLEPLASRSHYLLGPDARQWQRDVPHYAKVKYRDLYPGIDLVYYGQAQQLEYDFVVAPGVNPRQIKLAFSGPQPVQLTASGDLVLETSGGTLKQQKPLAYQEIAGVRRVVESRYQLLGQNLVGIELGSYDRSQPLVIDPVLGFAATFGTADDTYGNGIAVDLAGNSYVAGIAYSVRSQTIGRAGTGNVFVTKFNVAGQMMYTTYIGGGGEDVGFAVAVDRQGSAYVTGHADAASFPVTPGAYQTRFGGLCDAFVLKLTPRGNALEYCSFLGGNMEETGTGIAVDQDGQAYVAGETMSANFPAVSPLYRFGQAPTEAFVSKVSQNGSRLVYSTALTGSTTNPQGGSAAMGIDLNRRGDVVVAGFTTAQRFPTVNAVQDRLNGTIDAFVTRINRNGNRLDFSTYLGGTGEDAAYSVAMDAQENVYVTGLTNSTDYPTVNAFQSFLGGTRVSTLTPQQELDGPAPTGRDDAFVTKLFFTGGAVVYSTYLGGSVDDAGFGIAVNNAGEAHVTGRTRSTDFPTEDIGAAANGRLNGTIDAFATKFRSNGRALVYSWYLGGNGNEKGFCVAVWQNRVAFYTGLTTSVGWLPTNFAPPKIAGTASAFALQLASQSNAAIASVSGASYLPGALACDSIVSVFGEGISSGTESSDSMPLPRELGGVKVMVTDSIGKEFQAELFYASPFQINYHLPTEAATGPATIQIVNEDGEVFTETTRIELIAPGLFTADASGKGLATGYVTRVKAGQVVGDEPIVRVNAQGQLEAVPIDLGADDEEVFLVLFGTGIRHRNPAAPVSAKVADLDATVAYAGRQGDFVGLDQVNLRLPRGLKGRGLSSIALTIDGKAGNQVQVYIK
jgi:uncharacterized protein (TIGR03437 family)